jgi:poly(A) polymerase
VDDAGQRGEKVPPQVLLALVFGHFLEERADGFRQAGASAQQAMDMAVAEFLADLAPTVLIPHKIGIMVRDILACQYRLRITPGKRPQQVVARRCFADALTYLRFVTLVTGEQDGFAVWWERFSQEHAVPAVAPAEGECTGPEEEPRTGGGRKRRRRRRRGGKAPAGETPRSDG